MTCFPDTRDSLVARVGDAGDQQAWREFTAIYGPAIYRLARRRGLQPADADDLTQRVFLNVGRAVGAWRPDPARGRFRSWLATIVRNAAVNALTRRPPDAAVGGTSMLTLLATQPADEEATRAALRLEARRSLFRSVAERLREEFVPTTWQAFQLTAIDGVAPEAAAATLGKTVGAVYAARGRVMHRLRLEIERHERLTADDNTSAEDQQ